MVDTMPDTNVFDPYAGSTDRAVRLQWRTNRRVVYWLAYKEREGTMHQAGKKKGGKALLDAVTEQIEPPVGMTWNDFGQLWDLHPEHPFTPVLRKRSTDDEWHLMRDAHATEPPTAE